MSDYRITSTGRGDHGHGRIADGDLPGVAPAVAALTLAAAGLTLLAAFWLLRARGRQGGSSTFPAPAVHRPR